MENCHNASQGQNLNWNSKKYKKMYDGKMAVC